MRTPRVTKRFCLLLLLACVLAAVQAGAGAVAPRPCETQCSQEYQSDMNTAQSVYNSCLNSADAAYNSCTQDASFELGSCQSDCYFWYSGGNSAGLSQCLNQCAQEHDMAESACDTEYNWAVQQCSSDRDQLEDYYYQVYLSCVSQCPR